MKLNLVDKVALVTGGSHGLGKGICLSLASEGVKVAVNYRKSPEKAEAVIQEIKDTYGVEACAVSGDVSNEDGIVDMFDRTEQQFGTVDVLVNNAGICPVSYIKDMPAEMWRSTIEINLNGTFLASREMTRRLLEAERPGRIINVVSQAAFNGSATGKSHYSASKAGVVAFTVSLAKEVARNGITVNAIAPGMMLTEMTAETLEKNAERYNQQIPLGRIAETSEVADVITFLASDKAAYMTGATVDVSGGMLMR